MPELPEVETVKNALAPHLKGREVKSISFFTPKLRQELDEKLFNKLFSSYKILDLKRRSKYLIFKMNTSKWILSHLGMTGSWRICKADDARQKHEHISIKL